MAEQVKTSDGEGPLIYYLVPAAIVLILFIASFSGLIPKSILANRFFGPAVILIIAISTGLGIFASIFTKKKIAKTEDNLGLEERKLYSALATIEHDKSLSPEEKKQQMLPIQSQIEELHKKQQRNEEAKILLK